MFSMSDYAFLYQFSAARINTRMLRRCLGNLGSSAPCINELNKQAKASPTLLPQQALCINEPSSGSMEMAPMFPAVLVILPKLQRLLREFCHEIIFQTWTAKLSKPRGKSGKLFCEVFRGMAVIPLATG